MSVPPISSGCRRISKKFANSICMLRNSLNEYADGGVPIRPRAPANTGSGWRAQGERVHLSGWVR
jgi:hypothetical protein